MKASDLSAAIFLYFYVIRQETDNFLVSILHSIHFSSKIYFFLTIFSFVSYFTHSVLFIFIYFTSFFPFIKGSNGLINPIAGCCAIS